MPATNAALASGGMTHCFCRCGRRRFFLASARSCCRWLGQRSSVPRPALPAVATSTACDPSAVWNRPRQSASPRHGIEAFFHQLLAGPSNGVDAGIEGDGDFAVPPSFASLRGISLQQNACLGQLPGRVLTGTYQRVEPFPLLIAELHHVSLLGNLFRGHEASPSLRS